MAKGPLEGIKVLDFTWYVAGPTCTKQLADMGATVVKVESSKRLDPQHTAGAGVLLENPPGKEFPSWDRVPVLAIFHSSKLSMALNMRHPKALGIAKRLVHWADVIINNFRPGAIDRMGLSYEVVKEINPDIIMVTMSTLGYRSSDNLIYKEHPGAGNTGGAQSGLTYLAGWPDSPPVDGHGYTGHFGDDTTAMFSAMAIVAAIDYRRRTGKGQFIDSCQFETVALSMAPMMLDYQVNERKPNRMGNRHPWAAPHGIFRCRGDNYCAVTIFTQEQWQALCQVMGTPQLMEDERFATPQARKAHEDELERIVEGWTQNYTPQQVMEKLQGEKVPAGVVQTIEEIMDKDPQNKALGTFPKLGHPAVGMTTHVAPPFKLSLTPGELRTSPCLGQHTEYVCTKFLEMSQKEFEGLKAEGVFE